MREAICFMFNHIPGLSALFGAARGRKCVMLSDNRGRKPRDRHIHLGDNIKSSQLALLFTVRDVIKKIIAVLKILFKNARLSNKSNAC